MKPIKHSKTSDINFTSIYVTSDPCFSAPPHVHNGMRIYLGNNHGSKAKYKCYDGYRLHGMNSTYLKCEFGEWKGGRPHCEECKSRDNSVDQCFSILR